MQSELISCAVVGASGRMGRRLCALIDQTEGYCLAGATEHAESPFVGAGTKELMGLQDDIKIVSGLEDIRTDADVIIDFTFPEVSLKTAAFAAETGARAVIGTTAFTEEDRAAIHRLSASFPCVCAPNMSMGVNTLFKIVRDVAAVLGSDFDIEIMEVHHRHKKDAPSGTALRLGEIAAEARGAVLSEVGVYERKGKTGERRAEEIGMQALRAGDVAGEHTVMFAGNGERLELIHRAHSRDCFARGALHAARWLMQQPNGLYDMQDVLGLRP